MPRDAAEIEDCRARVEARFCALLEEAESSVRSMTSSITFSLRVIPLDRGSGLIMFLIYSAEHRAPLIWIPCRQSFRMHGTTSRTGLLMAAPIERFLELS